MSSPALPGERPAAGPNAFQGLSVSGVVAFADGTSIIDRNIQFQLVVDGVNLFQAGVDDCTETPAHIAGTVIVRSQSDARGSYAIDIPAMDIHAAVVKACALHSILPNRVTGLRLDASFVADRASCAHYCQGSADGGSCIESCASGGRLLGTSRTLTQSEFEALVSQASSNQLSWQQPLVIKTLGPSIAEGMGPNLRVDAEGARSTAHVTQETFDVTACEVAEQCVRAPGLRTLLRFDGTIQNLGDSDLVLGSPDSNPQFEMSSCHHVNLLKDIMEYELLDALSGQPVVVDGMAVVGRKAGFCMIDIAQVNASAPQGPYTCDNQGISVGWADIYDSSLECQFLDVTGVRPGDYTLRVTVNPDGVLPEADTTDNQVEVLVEIK